MSARVLLLTGATAGIGREAARRLAAPGTTLILPARDAARGRALKHELERAVPGVTVHVPRCDLSRLDDVRALASYVTTTVGRLDVLAHNAAVVPRSRRETADGHEMQFGVNHLAPFLLTALLRDLLVRSAPARVVVTASKVHFDGRLDFGDLQARRDYDHARAYNQSKLANVCFTFALARRLAGTEVTANCLHPGVYATTLLGDLFAVPRLLRFRVARNFPAPSAGGAALARLMTEPTLADVTGRYFDEVREVPASAEARDEAVQERLWDASETLTRLRP
jgi:NAD(P)-dependent dehydrogenase (short-subunit alcohol dehydrogenase family)